MTSIAVGTPTRTREQRTLLAGVFVVVVALLFSYLVLPFALRWRHRDAQLESARARVQELTSLTTNARALDSAARDAERSLETGGRRVIRARSAALAASALQSLLQDASDASNLVVTRLDVASNAAADSANIAGMTSIPATLSAHCDIAGLAELLAHFANGPRLVQVERMTVQMNSALRGAPDVLQVTLALRAPVVIE